MLGTPTLYQILVKVKVKSLPRVQDKTQDLYARMSFNIGVLLSQHVLLIVCVAFAPSALDVQIALKAIE